MSLKIRLARGGAKKRPFYRIVIADSRSPRDGRFIEKIGTYNPMLAKDHPDRIVVDLERAKHWLSVGARPSDRVARFLGQAEIIAMPPVRNNPKKSQPKAKAVERLKQAEEAAAAPPVAAAEPAAQAEDAPAAEAAVDVVAEDASAEPAAEAAPTDDESGEETPAEDESAETTPDGDGEETKE